MEENKILEEMHDLLSEMDTITQPEKDAIVNAFYQYLKNKQYGN